MRLPTSRVSSKGLRNSRRRRGGYCLEVLEERTLLASGSIPAGMTLAQATSFYNNVFLPSASVPAQWNGNVAAGDAGTLGASYADAIIARVDAYRTMAGLSGDITLDPTESAEDQQDALMIAASQDLTHTPASTSIDYTAAGADAAANSDIALGASGTTAIDLYMTDAGDNNTVVGHRRWILDPTSTTMGVGDIPGQSNALYVVQPESDMTTTPSTTVVAWPPAGFVPSTLMPARWSVQAPYGSDFTNATVTVTENGVPQQVQILSDSGANYGGQAVVWDMPNAPAPQPGQQVVYSVDVSNVVINGQTQSFSYQTTSFDPVTPATSSPVQTTSTSTSAGSATVDNPTRLVTLTSVMTEANSKHQVMSITLTFSGALDPNDADNANGIYEILVRGKKGSHGRKAVVPLGIRSASYSATNNTVTLIPQKAISFSKLSELLVNGSAPSGLHDSAGNYIDGDGNGTPGGNAIAYFANSQATIDVLSKRAFARLHHRTH